MLMKFIQINNMNINATWVAGKSEADFIAYASKSWGNSHGLKGKTDAQKATYLKNVYKLAVEAVKPPVKDVKGNEKGDK